MNGSKKERYKVFHALWKGIIEVDRDRKIASRIRGNGSIIDTASIESVVSERGCPNGLKLVWPRYQSREILNIHRDGTAWLYGEHYFLLPLYRKDPFLSATICRRKKWISYKTPKNGCSTVMFTSLREDQGRRNPDFCQRPWDEGRSRFSKMQSIDRTEVNDPEYRDYRKFLIWNDPVERFLIYGNYLYVQNLPMPVPYLQFGENDKKSYIEKIIKYYECILSPDNRAPQDEHVMKQCDVNPISIIAKGLDDVVMLCDLNEYMRLELDSAPEQSNISKIREITRSDFSADQLKRIKELYQEDYLFFETIQSKIWIND